MKILLVLFTLWNRRIDDLQTFHGLLTAPFVSWCFVNLNPQ